jgi:hypothetical protein
MPSVTKVDDRGPTHIAADEVGNVYVTLVDYNPGSKLDLRLTEIERKLDHIFALLVSREGLTRDDIEEPRP